MRIVFFGTPEFAVTSLNSIYQAGFEIVSLVTSPDKPAGRGRELRESPVKKYGLEKGIPILQPQNLKDTGFIETLKHLKADLHVVVAFRMLPEAVWNMPPHGTINLHASLLPQYRGAAPINRAIMNGEKETGVSTFFLKHEIDTGDLILTEKTEIGPEETAGELHDRLMILGGGLLVKTLQAIEKENVKEFPQPLLPGLKTAPKLFREDARINWEEEGTKVFNHIRGLSPHPAAYMHFKENILKVYRAVFIPGPGAAPGSLYTDQKTFLHVGVKDGVIALLELQLEGKKRLEVKEFLRGIKI